MYDETKMGLSQVAKFRILQNFANMRIFFFFLKTIFFLNYIYIYMRDKNNFIYNNNNDNNK